MITEQSDDLFHVTVVVLSQQMKMDCDIFTRKPWNSKSLNWNRPNLLSDSSQFTVDTRRGTSASSFVVLPLIGGHSSVDVSPHHCVPPHIHTYRQYAQSPSA
jgi:hypothetical protein